MRRALIALTAATALTACGGAGTPVTKAPPVIPAAGFANGMLVVITPGDTFVSTGTGQQATSQPGAPTISNIQVSFTNNADRNTIDVTVGSETVTLTKNGSAPEKYVGPNLADGSNVELYLDHQPAGQQAELGRLVIIGPSNNVVASFVSGWKTDPAQVAALASTPVGGSATYSGSSNIRIQNTAGDITYGNGPVVLNADFTAGNQTISGFMDITEGLGNFVSTSGAAITGTATLNISSAPISGNGFTTSLNASTTELAKLNLLSISGSNVDGTFFGPNATDVGGTFSSSGTSSLDNSTAVLTGGFLGKRP